MLAGNTLKSCLSAGFKISMTLAAVLTPHCNDDLNKINEQDEPKKNSNKWMIWLCKITIFKMISPAVFEIQASMHSQSAQIWRNFWPVLYRPSKTAGDIILKTGILRNQSIHLLEFINGSSCSFFLLRSSLQ